MKKNIKKILNIFIILAFLIGISTAIFLYIKGYDISELIKSINHNIYVKIGIILLVYIFRNYLLIPSTLIIIASSILLQNFGLTFTLGVIGVAIGIAQTYWIGRVFREDIKQKPFFKKMMPYNAKIREKGFVIVFSGCMFPALPTDIICYASGFVRYNFGKFMLAGMLGELPLILLYSFLGGKANEYMSYFIYFIGVFFIGFLVYSFIQYKKKKGK